MLLLPDKDREDMQGLILSGYGHLPNAMFLFLQIHDQARKRVAVQNIAVGHNRPNLADRRRWPQD